MGRMASIHAARMIKALGRLGWHVVRSSGSHHVLKNGDRTITIPVHKGQTLKQRTARAILESAGVTEERFFSE